jgi:anti-sigma factor RsiW
METQCHETEDDRRLSDLLRVCAPRHTARAGMRRKIAALLREQHRAMRPGWPELPYWLGRQIAPLATGFAAASALGLGGLYFQAQSNDDEFLGQQIVSAQIRSNMPSLPPMAAASADSLRSWLANRLSFSPAVAELSSEGYRLVTGRLEHVSGRAVASIQYSHGDHLVNVLACPLRGAGKVRTFHRDGFNVVGWTDSQLQYWAVSDVDARELSQFATSYRRAAGQF